MADGSIGFSCLVSGRIIGILVEKTYTSGLLLMIARTTLKNQF